MATIRVKNPNLGGEKWITIPTKILSEADHIVTNKGQGDLYLSNDGTYKDVIKSANDYTDKLIELITGSSPDILETLKELSNQTSDNKDFINVLNKSIATKLDKTANAVSASKLATPIRLWGNDFDGSLSVYGNLCAPNGNLGLGINANNVVLGNNTSPSYIYGSSVMFKTGTDAVSAYISSDGKVGIGTANPLVGFHVNVNSYFDYPIKVSGTVDHSSPLLKLDATNTNNNGLLVLSKLGNSKAAIGIDDTQGMWFLNLSNSNIFRITSNSLTYGSNKIWHEGNFNPSDYLPLSGGKLIGDLQIGEETTDNTAAPTIILWKGDGTHSHRSLLGTVNDGLSLSYYNLTASKYGRLKVNETGMYFTTDGSGLILGHKIWHEGNDGEGSGLDADLLDGLLSNDFVRSHDLVGANNIKGNALGYTYMTEEHGGKHAGGIISFGTSDFYCLLNGCIDDYGLSYRYHYGNSETSNWKDIAFTDYNGFYNLYGGTRILPSANNIADLNNYKTVGTYHVMQYSDTLYVENMPERNSFILHVVACNGASLYYLKQIFQPYNSAKEYVRFYPASSGRWSEWWLSNDDLNTYNAPTATDADMLDGKHGKAYQKAVYEYIIPEGTHDETAKKLDDTTIPNVVGYGSWNEYDFGFVDTKFYQDLNTSKVRTQISYGVRTNNAWMRNFNDKTQLWSDWRAFAFVDSNVASATKLATPVKLWGNEFDGSSDVNGDLYLISKTSTGTNSDSAVIRFNGTYGVSSQGPSIRAINEGLSYGRKRLSIFQHDANDYSTENEIMSILPNGNVGIGTTNPQYKLDINGTASIAGNMMVKTNLNVWNDLAVGSNITSGDYVDWYGVSWSEDSSDPTCTRIGNMALHRSLPILNAMRLYAISVHGAAVQNIILPFDDNMNIKYGTLSNYASGVTDETPIATMVKIPEFWYIDDYEPTTKTHNLKISQTAKAGWCHHKEAYVGAYEGYHDGTYYRSTKNAVPTVSKTREQLRTAARANGYEDEYKWNIYTYEEHRAICHLFLVEYATRNSQAPVNTALTADGFKQGGLGSGCTTGTVTINGQTTYSFIPTGTTDSLGNGSGQVAYTVTLTDADGNEIGTVTRYANRYRGIENPFGHIWKHVDDIVNVYNAETTYKTVYKCNKPEHFATNKNTKYKPLCSFPGGSKMQGWSKEIKATINCDFFKYSVGGSESTYWCDYNYDNDDTSEHCLLIGGFSGYGGRAGLFYLDLANGVGLSAATVGSRLTYLPWAE